MAAIELNQVVKRYGQGPKAVQVIHGVNAHITDGEFIVMVGPSGCGKSTLLRMVAGLERISDGTISIGNRVVNDLEPAERDIAMVFQNYALYPHMSVYDNMAYGLRIKGLDKAAIKTRVDKAAGILELGNYLDRRPGQLSGGQRQRVAMGRAIVREPQVFLFDEPLSNLDAKLRAQTRFEIQKLHRELGITSLYVTHDQVEAMTLAQRMIVLNAGRVEQMGTPSEVYERPATTFVATFIGAPPMNVFASKLIASNAHFMPTEGRNDLKIAQIGVRPEHLRIAATGLALRVEMVELLGAERLVYGRPAADPGAALVVVRLPSTEAAPGTGEAIHVAPLPGHLHAFDAQGLRVEQS